MHFFAVVEITFALLLKKVSDRKLGPPFAHFDFPSTYHCKLCCVSLVVLPYAEPPDGLGSDHRDARDDDDTGLTFSPGIKVYTVCGG